MTSSHDRLLQARSAGLLLNLAVAAGLLVARETAARKKDVTRSLVISG